MKAYNQFRQQPLSTETISRDKPKGVLVKRAKVCNCCKKVHTQLDRTRLRSWAAIKGWAYDCSCGSTLLVMDVNIVVESL